MSGSLIKKWNALHNVEMDYNPSGLPKSIAIDVNGNSYNQAMQWYKSGKLKTKDSSLYNKKFIYNTRGHLQSENDQSYQFDFGNPGIGIRTEAPHHRVSEVDPFGKVLSEKVNNQTYTNTYDNAGQQSQYKSLEGLTKFSWDVWGRLSSIVTDTYIWEAKYDALGRRLQTIYKPKKGDIIETKAHFDPETEFQEIGLQVNDKTFWKIYSNNTCEAIINEQGEFVQLMHEVSENLIGLATSKEFTRISEEPSIYGQSSYKLNTNPNLVDFAQAHIWQSRYTDPTGFIWMGARYYNPSTGRFISADPVGHPLCLDLYNYADGDPVNFIDPDGRFATHAYQTTKSTVVGIYNDHRFQGGLQALGGFSEAGIGAAMTYSTAGTTSALGWPLMAHGLDNTWSGLKQAYTGRQIDPVSVQLLEKAGLSHSNAHIGNNIVSLIGSMSGSAALLNKSMNRINQSINVYKQKELTNYSDFIYAENKINKNEAFFKEVKIQWDKQNKHVPGKHNYEKGRSIFEHDDAQRLLTKFSGKGQSVNSKLPGMPDYRERVDFGEFIGYYIPDNKGNIKIPTNKGIIIYSKTGAHIIPSNPKGY